VTIRTASTLNSRLKRLRLVLIDTSQPIIGLDQVSTEPGQDQYRRDELEPLDLTSPEPAPVPWAEVELCMNPCT
jgi:hypothetical protein